MIRLRKEKGITLIALVVTIIILIILAGVVLNFVLGNNGILNRAEESKTKYIEVATREKLEMVLMGLSADKQTDIEYNEIEYINNRLVRQGMQVEDNIVTVDGWKFEIDRSIPKIIASLGKDENNEESTAKKNAMVFDQDGYIQTNLKQSDFIQTNGKFTIGARVKINKVGQQIINSMGILGSDNTEGYVWKFVEKTEQLQIGKLGSGITIDYTPYYDKWTDIIVTYKNGNNKLYINGQLIKEEAHAISPYGNFLIGTSYLSQDTRMKGMIAGVNIWNDELTEQEIKKVSLLTDETAIKSENVKLKVILDSIEDVSKIGTINGNARFELRDFALEYAIKFLGNTYINTKWNQSDIIKNGQYTICARVKIIQNEQSQVPYMDILGNHIDGNGFVWEFLNTTQQLFLRQVTIDYKPYYDKWTNIIYTVENGTCRIYVNKELVGTAENVNNLPYYNFIIGTSYKKENRTMIGSIASVKMWKVALTQEEINNMNMLKQVDIQQENIVNQVLLENDEAVNEIGNFVGSNYTYILRH